MVARRPDDAIFLANPDVPKRINSGCGLTITTARGSTLSIPTGIPTIHFVSNFEIVIEHVRQFVKG
jgi:hypothetical protein